MTEKKEPRNRQHYHIRLDQVQTSNWTNNIVTKENPLDNISQQGDIGGGRHLQYPGTIFQWVLLHKNQTKMDSVSSRASRFYCTFQILSLSIRYSQIPSLLTGCLNNTNADNELWTYK